VINIRGPNFRTGSISTDSGTASFCSCRACCGRVRAGAGVHRGLSLQSPVAMIESSRQRACTVATLRKIWNTLEELCRFVQDLVLWYFGVWLWLWGGVWGTHQTI